MQTRPLTDESCFTCDWGGCDEYATAERFHADHGWLTVCDTHGARPSRPKATRGRCAHCGKDYALSVGGLVRAHDNGFATRCPGSAKPPTSSTLERTS